MRPAQPDEITRIIQFDGPVYDVTLVVFHVKKNLAMRIGPDESSNGSLQGDPLRKIVPLRAVVCNERSAKQQKANRQSKKPDNSAFHATPPACNPNPWAREHSKLP